MTQFDWLVAAFPKMVFTAFDTETTGLEPKQNRVVEAGGIRFDSRGIHSRFNTLINPKIPMPAEVTKINGITDAMLKNEPDASQVLPDFLSFIGDSVLIAHNAPFDIAFINEELARQGMKPLANRVVDTRIFAKEIFPGLPKYSLQELAVRFGIQAKDAHRAEDDARVCMELFLVCLAKLMETNPQLIAVEADAESATSATVATTAKTNNTQTTIAADVAAAAKTESDAEQPDLYADDLFSDDDESEELFEDMPE